MLPVPAERPRIVPAASGSRELLPASKPTVIPAVQAAAAAAGGFVAGAALAGLVHRHTRTRALRASQRPRGVLGRSRSGQRGGRGGVELLQIVGSRSLLLDVHLLGGPGAQR
jgi:hypothetical protein